MRSAPFIYTTLSAAVLLLFITISDAQNVTSPYSILGIGDVDTRDYGRYFITGSTGISRRNPGSFNFSNPASLSSLPFKTMNMDVAMRGRASTFQVPGEDTTLNVTKDFIVKRVTLAFKPDEKTGIAFGLKPYSSVNYKFQQDQVILDGNSTYSKYIEGNGGINQFFFSVGRSISKKISVGITASWLFGSLQRTTSYASSSIDLSVIKDERDFYNAGQLLGGVQYYTAGKKWKHQLGLTASASTTLKGQLTTEYSDAGVSVLKEIEDNRKFKLPVTIGLGYTAIKNDRITFSAEANYYHWKYQKVDYTNSYTNPSLRLSAGMEFAFKSGKWNNPADRTYLGWGINAENSYLRINNQQLRDYSFSFGGGLTLFRNVAAYGGVELGLRGSNTKNQIRETYTQFIFGITIRDIWLGTKKFGRYD